MSKKFLHHLHQKVEQWIQQKASSQPFTIKKLLKALHLKVKDTVLLKKILQSYIEKDYLKKKGPLYFKKISQTPSQSQQIFQEEIMTGIISIHPKGFGFVRPDNLQKHPKDIFIPAKDTCYAIDKDHVEVTIISHKRPSKGPEGRVNTILKKARSTLAGIIQKVQKHKILAFVPLFAEEAIPVYPSAQEKLKKGDRYIFEIIERRSKKQNLLLKPKVFLGNISDASQDITATAAEFDLSLKFSGEAKKEAQNLLSSDMLKKLHKNREDLTSLCCFTIDPDTAKDFDDAVSLTKQKSGYLLGVHIADVTFYIKENSPLDKEAKSRANSTYFPETCIPMLPKELSESLCSLQPDQIKATVSVFMHFDKKGTMVDYRITRSLIKSQKRFTYKEVKKILDGKNSSPFKKTLQEMVKLCLLLKKKRKERGSLDISLPEISIQTDAKGTPHTTEIIEYDISHQLIEEFMLKTNETVSSHLSQKKIVHPYRIHDKPNIEDIQDFVYLAQSFGFSLPDSPSPEQLQQFFDEAFQTPFGEYLANTYIRKMKQAIYSPDNIGHYGLASSHYCHFTSPIRRYIDLVIHRILLEKKVDYEILKQISTHASNKERVSQKAEMFHVLLKKLRLLKEEHKKNPQKKYSAIITSIKPFGMFIEIQEYLLESFISLSELTDDYWEFDNKKLVGTKTSKTYLSGQIADFVLQDVDLITLKSKWVPYTKKSRKRKKKRK